MDETFYVLAFSDGTWATGNADPSGVTAPVYVAPTTKFEVYAGAEAQKYWEGRILDASEADREEIGHAAPCVPVSSEGVLLVRAVRCLD